MSARTIKLMLLIFSTVLTLPMLASAAAGRTSHLYSCSYYQGDYRLNLKVVHTTQNGDTKISDWMHVNAYRTEDSCNKVASELNSKN